MARPREFNPDEALEQAMQAFWSKGYEATSLSDLTRAMGISRSSFYETFGSKHALFLDAIERFGDTAVERSVAGLEGDGPARAAIAQVFGRVVDNAVGRGDRRGCFVCNCATEVSPHDPEAAARVAACLGRFEAAFHAAVTRGQRAGEIAADRDPRALARYLTSSLNGLGVMTKARPDRAALDDVVRVVLSALD